MLVASSARAGDDTRVGVLALGGSADPNVRRAGDEALVGALRGVESLQIVSLLDLKTILGAEVAGRADRCADDRCRVKIISALGLDRLVLGEVVSDASGDRLGLRVVDSSTQAATAIVRLSRDLSGDLLPALRGALIGSVAELFPDHAKNSFGTVAIDTSDGAAIILDGAAIGVAPISPLRLATGKHTFEISKKGYEPFKRELVVLVGQTAALDAELDRIRSNWPLYLGASALSAIVVGTMVGISAQTSADNWTDACPAGAACGSGFTRQRFEDDGSTVDLQRNVANGLFVAAGALAVGALVTLFFDPGAQE